MRWPLHLPLASPYGSEAPSHQDQVQFFKSRQIMELGQ
uniref:Uncharacterized protein n=1 Tax=Arundo donax TaxID=35708 RepID=A0A0A9C4V2_ARUDO